MVDPRPLIFTPGVTLPEGNVHVDLNRLLAGRLLVQANSGGGKSYLLRYLLEQTAGHVAHLVLDPEGEYYTLRERHPYVLVGRGGDVEPDQATAAALAAALAEAGASAVFDVSDLAAAERDGFLAAFLRGLVALPQDARRHTLLVADEAQTIAPEGGSQTAAGAALVDVAMRGRKRGIGLVVATQRLALLSKSLVAQCSNRIVGLTTLGADQALAARELGFNTAERAQLRTLQPGQFFAFGPAISQDVVLVQSGAVLTTHPEPGRVVPPLAPADEALAGLVASLRALAPVAVATDVVTGETGMSSAEPRSSTEREVSLQRRLDAALAYNVQLAGEVETLRATANRVARELTISAETFAESLSRGSLEAMTAHFKEEQGEAAPTAPPSPPVTRLESAAVVQRPQPARSERAASAPGKLPPARQRILDALCRLAAMGLHSVDRRNLAAFARQSPKSSAYGAHVAELEKAGLVRYPAGGHVTVTEAGRAAGRSAGLPPSLEELHREWLGYLTAYQSGLLKVLLEQRATRPDAAAMKREMIAQSAGRSITSSAFGDAVSTLQDLGLVRYPRPGWVVATDLLFPSNLT